LIFYLFNMLDLVIIGAAAAGSSAAIYAARRNLNFVIVTKDVGGEVALSGEVENWVGIERINGFELAQNFINHVKSYNVPIEEGFEAVGIEQKNNYHIVKAKNILGQEKIWEAKTVIVASGIHPRKLGIEGEETFKGKGVVYCTVCDGPLFKNKITATVGAGNSALESALMMSGIAQKVYLITKYPNAQQNNFGFPKGENILIKKVKEKENVEIIYQANVAKLFGDKVLAGLEYEDLALKKLKKLEAQAVMVHIGMVPNSSFVSCAEKNPAGEIKVNTRCETSCPGLFAAGDVTDVPFKQISISAGHGTIAALSAIGYLNHFEE
jgi:alkyl hydroperoxide reductase subunit AhpF